MYFQCWNVWRKMLRLVFQLVLKYNIPVCFSEHPLSLQSCCRIAIRKSLSIEQLCHLEEEEGGCSALLKNKNLVDFLQFRQLFLSTNQIPILEDAKILVNLNQIVAAILGELLSAKTRSTSDIKHCFVP
jgi:hypothetical protein